MTKKVRYAILIIFTVTLLTAFYLSLNFGSKNLFPFDKNEDFIVKTYHEQLPKDWSTSTASIDSGGGIKFTYQLTSVKDEPFTGFYITKKDSLHDLFSVDEYNSVKIHIKAKKAKRIPLTITVDYKGFTSRKKELSSMPFTTTVDYDGDRVYEIKLSQFTTPSWWYRYHQLSEKDFMHPDFTRANYFIVGNCELLAKGVEDEIIVKSVQFTNDNTTVYFVFGLIAIAGYSAMGIYVLFARKKKVLVPFVANEISDEARDKTGLIVQYLSKNYINAELTQIDVQRDLGISAREIGQLLKDNHHSSFKNYLNQIRLAEVKRLLKDSNLPISDIAYKAGYNNISHFNRVFKSEVGVSPKQFREQ
ncbi:MAG: AraC family transcriptional regulator [Bacteroidetes bacterium]|nr:AraC family transcriptional regulator [Bacteroidota bacterium]